MARRMMALPTSWSPAEESDEIAWSLRLLATTGIHVSLLRISIPGLLPELVVETAHRAFGSDGVYGRRDGSSVVVLLVDSPEDELTAETRAIDAIVMAAMALGIQGAVEVSCLHAFANEVADVEDAVANLALATPRAVDIPGLGGAATA